MRDKQLQNFIDIMAMVQAENCRQLEKWGVQDKPPDAWLNNIIEELGEVAAAIADFEYRAGPSEAVRAEAIQTATLLLKLAEMFAGDLGIKKEDIC